MDLQQDVLISENDFESFTFGIVGYAAVREKGVELESILLEEKKKAEDLNSKLTFYGGAYSKLSNKLQGTHSSCFLC